MDVYELTLGQVADIQARLRETKSVAEWKKTVKDLALHFGLSDQVNDMVDVAHMTNITLFFRSKQKKKAS